MWAGLRPDALSTPAPGGSRVDYWVGIDKGDVRMAGEYRFSFGPWNIHEGADPFGPTVRRSIPFAKKLKMFKKLGFDGVQFHDDDAVPDMNKLSPKEIVKKAKDLRKVLQGEGLTAEFVAPRLWEDPRTIDGGYTSNDPEARQLPKTAAGAPSTSPPPSART